MSTHPRPQASCTSNQPLLQASVRDTLATTSKRHSKTQTFASDSQPPPQLHLTSKVPPPYSIRLSLAPNSSPLHLSPPRTMPDINPSKSASISSDREDKGEGKDKGKGKSVALAVTKPALGMARIPHYPTPIFEVLSE